MSSMVSIIQVYIIGREGERKIFEEILLPEHKASNPMTNHIAVPR